MTPRDGDSEADRMPTLEVLTGGVRTVLTGSLGAPDLDAAGYVESEWRCRGTAVSYAPVEGAGTDALAADGRWTLAEADEAGFTTRAVLRRPADPGTCSGTVVIEWLNVSSGADSAPLYGFLAPELVRRGHVWLGVSAQWAGVVGAPPLVAIGDDDGHGMGLVGLRDSDPERYASLRHPGDAFSYDIFTQVASAFVDPDGPALADVDVRNVLAVGESQSAYALTTYANGVQPRTRRFDGFLVHSRGGPAMPLGEPGRGVDLAAGRDDRAVTIRSDLDAPVLVVETETDVLGHLRYLPARQPDADGFRLWEVAGAAHADRSLVGRFEDVLGCDDPVNRGQQRFVVRAALRALDGWTDARRPPPCAPRLVVEERDGRQVYATDDVGNVRGGVRTPCVDAPTEVLSGLAGPGASHVCRLFGRTLPAAEAALRGRYTSAEDYLARYERAVDATIDAGFALVEDRDELLADARPDLIAW